MSTRRGRRKTRGRGRGRGRLKGKGKTKGRSQGSSLNSSSSNLESIDNLNNQQKTLKPQNQPEIFVGLDVGSSSIKIAVIQNNAVDNLTNLQQLCSLFLEESNNSSSFHSKINLLADDSGERCIPSVITILDSTHTEILIGTEAVKSSIRHYKNSIYHSKHLISFTQNNNKSHHVQAFQSQFNQWKKSASKFGMHKCVMQPVFDVDDNFDDKENKTKEESIKPLLKVKYRLKKNNSGAFQENIIDNAFVLMLKKIFTVISSQTGSTNINVVSCVPYYYTSAQITYYKSLLLEAGFNPLQIIYDHSAAILSLHFDNNMATKSILCIDFSTFYSTFAVVKMCHGFITSAKDENNENNNYYNKTTEISGMALDECILKWLIKDFERRNKGCFIEIENAKTRLKLLKEITRIKQVLSSGSNQVRFDIESVYEGIDYHFTLSQPKFESIVYDVLNEATNWITQQIKQSDLSFDFVIVSGGFSEIPKLQNSLQNMFGDKLMTKALVSKGIASTFVNVYGCAVQVASLSYLYQFQNQIQNGHASLEKILDVSKMNKNKNKSKNKNKNKKKDKKQPQGVKERNIFLTKLSNNLILLSSKRICLYYILGQQRKQFCCIEKHTALPFETNYTIKEHERKTLNELQSDISFTVDIIDDKNKETMEQSINMKSKKKNKNLLINVTLDDNNDLTICIGKEKLLFELDEVENDSDDADDVELKTDDIDDNTIDID